MFVDVYFWYPESRGRTLERMAFIFDGDEAIIEGIDSKLADNEQEIPAVVKDDI